MATKVEIRFNVEKASWLPDWIKPRLTEKVPQSFTALLEALITLRLLEVLVWLIILRICNANKSSKMGTCRNQANFYLFCNEK